MDAVDRLSQEEYENGSNNEPVTASAIETGWKNPPTLADLIVNMNDARPHHEDHKAKVSKWLEYLHVTGAAKRKSKRGRSQVQPMLIRKHAEWRYANLSGPILETRNIFNVNPVTALDVYSARQNALVLNNQFNTKLHKVQFVDRMVRTLVNEGTAIIRVSWDYQTKVKQIEVPDYSFRPASPEIAQAYQGMLQAHQQGESMGEVPEKFQVGMRMSQQTGTPVEAVVTGSHLEDQVEVVKNQPRLDICDYTNVIVDPLAKGVIDDANFIIFEFTTSKSDLRKQTKRYHNIDAIGVGNTDVVGGGENSITDETQTFNYKDAARKKYSAYEYWGYWDYNGTGIAEPFVATWIGDVMVRLEVNPYPDGKLPFVLIQYLPDDKGNFGEPDGALLSDNQDIIGAVTRGMIDVMARSANGQIGTRQDAMDAPNRRKLGRGEDFEFRGDADPRNLFHSFAYPELPQSATYMLGLQNQDAESLSGVKAFAGGAGLSGASLGDSATGIRSAMDSASKRESAILLRVSVGLIEIGRKVIAMNSAFLDETEVVRITDEEFVEVKRDDLAGNFDLSLSIATAEENNSKASELAFMLQTTGPGSDPQEVRMIRAEIARLRNMPDLAKKIEDYEPQPDPMAIEKQQLEIELLKAQIANENAKAHENNANGEYDMSRLASEAARARKLNAEADAIDLGYIEQESGVEQERKKEIVDMSHRSSMDQKEFDAKNPKPVAKPTK